MMNDDDAFALLVDDDALRLPVPSVQRIAGWGQKEIFDFCKEHREDLG